MSQINESPSNGRATEAFRIPFAVWGALRYICLTRDKLSIPENYPNLSNVRPNPCEHSVFGSLIFKKDQNATQKSCCTNRATPRTARQPNWNHVDRGNLVRHTVDTMMERAVALTKEMK